MSFDIEPDGDPHGQCAEEIHRLESELSELSNRLIERTRAYEKKDVERCSEIREISSQNAQMRELVETLVPCRCHGKCEEQIQFGYVCIRCKTLSTPAPAMIPREDVKPLLEALACMEVGICACAIPHAGERATASLAVSEARKVKQVFNAKHPSLP